MDGSEGDFEMESQRQKLIKDKDATAQQMGLTAKQKNVLDKYMTNMSMLQTGKTAQQ